MTFSRPFPCLITSVVTVLIVLGACASKRQSVLDIPEGYANQTLKEFSKQAEVEIIFNPQSVYGVKTNAVVGKYYPHSALRIMLEDTVLILNFDEETGAYGVLRNDL